MPNKFVTPPEEPMDAEFPPTLIPSNLWSIAYLSIPNILEAASQVNPERVGELFQAASPPPPVQTQTLFPAPSPSHTPSSFALRAGAPRITPYDGSAKNLRIFCATLRNQFLGQDTLFPDDVSKVRFAYQCLGPGALSKMRSCFRCLEDPSVPSEINSLDEFMIALKRECEDPQLRDKSTRAVEQMSQGDMRFHEFIKLFHDNIADSTYADVDKATWKTMLERRLSSKLREILLSASDVPSDYHEFVAYLRRKDAAIQEWRTAFEKPFPSPSRFNRPSFLASKPASVISSSSAPHASEPTVSQGGSAMDLDTVSREKGSDGRLTLEAKNARRLLGRCLWCNKTGHIRSNCPLGPRTLASTTTESSPMSEDLKEELQQ